MQNDRLARMYLNVVATLDKIGIVESANSKDLHTSSDNIQTNAQWLASLFSSSRTLISTGWGIAGAFYLLQRWSARCSSFSLTTDLLC